MSDSHAENFLEQEPWIKSLKEVDGNMSREFLGVADTSHFHNHVRFVNHESTLYFDGNNPYKQSLFICIQSLAYRGSEEMEKELFENILSKSTFFEEGNFKATKDTIVFYPPAEPLESKTTACDWEKNKAAALENQRIYMDKIRKEMIAQMKFKHENDVRASSKKHENKVTALRKELDQQSVAIHRLKEDNESKRGEIDRRAKALLEAKQELEKARKIYEKTLMEQDKTIVELKEKVVGLQTRIGQVKESSKTARTFYKKMKNKATLDIESIVAALDMYNSIDVKVMMEAMEFWKNVDDDVDWCLLKTLLDEHKSNKTMSYHEVENKMYKKVFSYLIKRFQRDEWDETCEKYTALINERELSTTDIDKLLDMVSTHLWLVPPSKKAEDPMVAFRDQLAYRNTFHWKLEEWSRKSNWGVDSLRNMLTIASDKNETPISIEFGAASTIITMCVPVDMLAWEFLYHAQQLTQQPVSFLLNRSNGKAIEPAQLMVCFPKVRML